MEKRVEGKIIFEAEPAEQRRRDGAAGPEQDQVKTR
jgi:hypothetical protein